MKRFVILPLLLLLASGAPAQFNRLKFEAAAAFDTSLNLTVTAGSIRIDVEKYHGRFALLHADGTPLLFTRNGYATSYTNVRIDRQTFTNNSINGPGSPEGTIAMPPGSARVENNTILFSADIPTSYGAVRLEQRFAPQIESNAQYLRITTTVRNTTPFDLPIGTLHVFDLMAGGSDQADVIVNGQSVPVETGFTGAAIPPIVEILSIYTPHRMRARLGGFGALMPQQFVVGRWQFNGYLGAAGWNYIPSGLAMRDNAMLMQWDQLLVRSGREFQSVTDYGIEESSQQKSDCALACLVQPVVWNDSAQAYQPNPFEIRGRITNTGNLPIPGFTCVAGPLLNGLIFAPGEAPTKVLPDTLQPGGTVDAVWKLIAPRFDADSMVSVPLRIAYPLTLARQCSAQTTIPAARIRHITAAEIYCGPPVRLAKDAVGAGYDPNPFPIEPVITNTGTEDLDSLTAEIILPPRLRLISGINPRLLNAYPLVSSASVQPLWVVQATPAFTADSVSYVIRVTNAQGIRIECAQMVYLPAVEVVNDCAENGPSTRGTEFWFNFSTDDIPLHSNPYSPNHFLYVAAERHTDITVECLKPASTIQEHIFPKNVLIVNLDKAITWPGGNPQRRSVHLASSEPVGLAIGRTGSILSEATGILPLAALGLEHTVLGNSEEVFVTGSQDGTTIGVAGAPGTPINRGDLYRFNAKDGEQVVADKPVFVARNDDRVTRFLGTVTNDGFKLFEELPPNSLLGKEYVAVPSLTRFGAEYLQIYSASDGNVVRINGTPYPLPDKSTGLAILLTRASYISADKPVAAMQFTMPTYFDKPLTAPPYGDGSMVSLVPADRFSTCHSFTAFIDNQFDYNAVTLAVPDGGEKDASLDGRLLPDSTFHLIPGAPYRVARIGVSKGNHRVNTFDQRGIGVVVYGFGFNDGYSYNTGYRIGKVTPIPASGDEGAAGSPSGFHLRNHPNPFGSGSETRSPATTITFRSAGGRVLIELYDLLGRKLATLADDIFPPGEQSVVFKGMTVYGPLASGMYIYRLEQNGVSATGRMAVIR